MTKHMIIAAGINRTEIRINWNKLYFGNWDMMGILSLTFFFNSSYIENA